MTFTCTINMDGAAFEDNGPVAELGRLLDIVTDRVGDGYTGVACPRERLPGEVDDGTCQSGVKGSPTFG